MGRDVSALIWGLGRMNRGGVIAPFSPPARPVRASGKLQSDLAALLILWGEFPFDRLGAFAYSLVDDTRTRSLPGPVLRAEAEARRDRALELQRRHTVLLQQRRMGQERELLAEGFDWSGATPYR